MSKITNQRQRRKFIQAGLTAGLGLPLFGCQSFSSGNATKGPLFTKFGIKGSLDQADLLAKQGTDFLLVGVNSFLKPRKSEAEFEAELRRLEKSPIPILSCNSFLVGRALRSVGPDAKHQNVLKFANTAFKRAKRAGVKRIIFGSSGSRRIREGWSKAQADEQFISLLKQMGDLAGAQGVVVAVENLQQRECNHLTRLHEVGESVTEVNHPHVRLFADIYYSSCMLDSPESFR